MSPDKRTLINQIEEENPSFSEPAWNSVTSMGIYFVS